MNRFERIVMWAFVTMAIGMFVFEFSLANRRMRAWEQSQAYGSGRAAQR